MVLVSVFVFSVLPVSKICHFIKLTSNLRILFFSALHMSLLMHPFHTFVLKSPLKVSLIEMLVTVFTAVMYSFIFRLEFLGLSNVMPMNTLVIGHLQSMAKELNVGLLWTNSLRGRLKGFWPELPDYRTIPLNPSFYPYSISGILIFLQHMSLLYNPLQGKDTWSLRWRDIPALKFKMTWRSLQMILQWKEVWKRAS